jgi:AcrR family transcriptional regulator
MVLSQRARNAEQKNARRQTLLAAARELLKEKPFHQISMADIATATDMAKGTVFLYFKTKEELFFCITVEEFEKWLDAMDELFSGFARKKTKLNKEQFLQTLGSLLQQHTLLLRLITILNNVLEHNIDYQEALRFKQIMGKRLPQTGAFMEQCLPELQPKQGFKFILWMYAFVIGFNHMAEPAPVIREVYRREPALRDMQIDFKTSYFDALNTVLDGWFVQNKQSKTRIQR